MPDTPNANELIASAMQLPLSERAAIANAIWLRNNSGLKKTPSPGRSNRSRMRLRFGECGR
jgi:hypothetical protein